MKRLNLSVVLFALLGILLLVSCTTVKEPSEIEELPTVESAISISGKFTNTSKYGNIDTDIPATAMFEAGFELGDICTITAGDITYDAPFVNSYGDVEPGNYLFHPHHEWVEFAICNGNYSKTTGLKEGDVVTITMKEKAGYLTQYEIRNIVKSEDRNDYISDSVFANVRAIQLGEIGFRKLYRSCNPILDDARGPYAAELLSEAGIKTVINLADKQEDLATKAAVAPNAEWYLEIVEEGNAIGLDMGIAFFDPVFISQLKEALIFMSEHEAPYLIHCNKGRDRAGYLSALLEALMGASTDEIWADYMASFDNYFGIKEDTPKYDAYKQIQIDQLKTVNGGVEITNATAADAVKNYFINTVGLTEEQVEALKANLR